MLLRLLSVLALVATAAAVAAAGGAPDSGGGHPRFLADAADPPDYGNCYLCHEDREPNTGDGWLRLDGVPAEYIPGSTIRLTVTMADPGALVWAFELTACDAAARQIGSFTLVDPRTELGLAAGREYPRSAQNAIGTFSGTPDGPVSWQVDWNAPPAGSGTAYFYMAALAGNLDGADTGDFTYTLADAAAELGTPHPAASLLLQPDDPLLSIGEPLIVRARVKNHGTAAQTWTVVSRARLPDGRPYPPNGWLLSPRTVTVPGGGLASIELIHPIPAGVPAMSPRYEAFAGIPPATLVDSEAFVFTLLR